MPWRVTGVMGLRIAFVQRVSEGRESFAAVCRAFGVSRPTGYRWWRRYCLAGSATALQDRSRRPQRSPGRTVRRVEAQVVKLRQRHGWGARKLRVLLAAEGIILPEITIHRILKRHDLIERDRSARPAVQRFERGSPNELWQVDFKGEMPCGRRRCYPLSVLDDHSRFAVGLFGLAGTRAVPVQRSLIAAFEQYGMPAALLLDHGPPWWSTTNGHGFTWLSVWLMQQGIRLCYSGVGHPQTQGKVERFHRTLKHAVRRHGYPPNLPAWQSWLSDFRDEYNGLRPHESLDLAPPASRYHPSPRAYDPHPPVWEYPEGAEVRRLNSQGCLDWQRRRLFVCEALAGQHVQIKPLDHLLLVRYRDTYVREIDLGTGRSRPLARHKDES
jgi:transposase InsO family protein